MKTWLLSYLTTIPSLAGVEIYLLGEGNILIRYAILKRKSNIVQFEKGEYHLNDLAELKKQIGNHLPIALTISGKGIMHRSLPTVEQWSDLDYARKILPNASLEEFLIQSTIISSNVFISLTRKADLANILAEFNKLKMEIRSLTLGPFAFQPVWSYLQITANTTIQLDAHNFTVTDNLISAYKMGIPLTDHSKKVVFADEEMNECIVTAYTTGLCLIANIKFPTVNLNSFNICKEDFNQRSIFKKMSTGILGFFILLLLTNAIFFMHYSSKIDENDTGNMELLKVEENALRLNLNKERELLNSITRPPNNRYGSLAKIADFLAVSQPLSIVLDEMSIFPSEKKESRKIRKPIFDFTLVKLTGSCSDGPELNTWLTDIRKLDFCQRVEIVKYTAMEKGTTSFTLNLFVK